VGHTHCGERTVIVAGGNPARRLMRVVRNEANAGERFDI
jgi:hypothetical protein